MASMPSIIRQPTRQRLERSQEEARHHRHRLRWWIGCCLTFLIVAPVASIMIGLRVHARDFQYIPDKTTIAKFSGRMLQVELVLISADPMNGFMTMDWTILDEAQSQCSASNIDACTDINIFFDNNLLSGDGSSFQYRTSDRPSQPIFKFNATVHALHDIVGNTPTFRTHLAMFSPGNRQSSPIFYPFDEYSAEIFIFAQDVKTNETVGLDFVSTRGIAVGFKTQAVTRPNVNIPPGMVDIVVNVQRGNLVKAFSIVTVLAVWCITLILLVVMLTCVFFGFRQKGEVLVIPVATLFAFTQLRQSMPGAPPGFGDVLDFVGLLPCLALLSLSAVLTLGAFIFSDPTEKPQVLDWDLLYEAFPMLGPKGKRKGDFIEPQHETSG
ncbi:hypothetical protein D9613_006280 [Agrocybe pediades]|uniref:Transmembrane protein n=1 Tax=Agrocybe pediades TaxID=84607 RepID=A0A8H4QUU8_9AGAR|nr:hypothetical protein D9613_006280 [Agrocybe pediades]